MVNIFFEDSVGWFHERVLKVDVSDLKSTSYGAKFSMIPSQGPFHEDYSGNVVFFISMLAVFFCFPFLRRARQREGLSVYFICVICSFLLFCFVIRWNPWVSRLHLAIILLSAPVLATILSKKFGTILGYIFIIIAIPWVVFNPNKPIIGKRNIFNTPRLERYFFGLAPVPVEKFHKIADDIVDGGYDKVGLTVGDNALEYPLWVLLDEKSKKSIRIEHVNIKNSSHKYESIKKSFFIIRY